MILERVSNKLQINNKYIGRIMLDKLFSLDIKIPNIQRILNEEKVNNIVKYQIENLLYDDFNLIGVINIHVLDKTNYLVDGQHRFFALKKLYSMGHNIPIFIEIICINHYNELKHNYNLINKNTPLPDLPVDIDKTIPETVALNIKSKYPHIWSSNSRAHRPNIYFDYFLEACAVISHKLNINSCDELEKLIEDYNLSLILRDKENLPDSKSISENMYNKCVENKFYLGLYKHISDEYRYDWVKKIIEFKKGIKCKSVVSNKKKNIPKTLLTDIWNKYIGDDIRSSKCICCNLKKISVENFHAGHIIPEKDGGDTTIDNLIPICSCCNSSMGVEHMDSFIKKFYPQNINSYMNRIFL